MGWRPFLMSTVVSLLKRAAKSARRSAALALIQYKGGQTDYTTVVSAEQNQLAVETRWLLTRQCGAGIIAVYRRWRRLADSRGHDVISDEVKAEMARRTDWDACWSPNATYRHRVGQGGNPDKDGK